MTLTRSFVTALLLLSWLSGATAAQTAVRIGTTSIVRYGSDKRFYKNGRECVARHPQEQALLSAIIRNNRERVRRLVSAGVSPNAKNDCGISALTLAASGGGADIVRELIQAGADVNVVDDFDPGTPLLWAIDHFDPDDSVEALYGVVKLLAEAGADLNWQNEADETALILAAEKGLEQVVELLIAAGADVNIIDNEGRTAYSYAAEYGHKRIKSLLVAARAKTDVGGDDFVREFGENAFMLAAGQGRTDIVEALLARGVSVNFRNRAGVTAIMKVGNRSTLDVLLSAGADVNNRDKFGFTALAWAAAVGDAELIKRLIKAGADVNAVTKDGQTVLSLAKPEVKSLLMAAGAKQ
jgi:uncharacterized protein